MTDGSIEFMGQRIDGRDPEDICRLGIVQVMEGRKVLETLTVEENLSIGGYTRRDPDGRAARPADDLRLLPRLVERRRQLAGYLIGGEQQMLVIGRALMARPKLMLLDEPSLGLAPLLVREIFEIIRQDQRGARTTFLLVEQNAQIALGSPTTATSWRTAGSSSTAGRQAPGQRRRPRVLPRPQRGRPAQELPGAEVLQAPQALGVLVQPDRSTESPPST